MSQTTVTAERKRSQLDESRRGEQRLADCQTKVFCCCRLQLLPVHRSAGKNHLHATFTPVPGHGQKIFQRPVFSRGTRERLNEQCRPAGLQFVFQKKLLRGRQRLGRQRKFIFYRGRFDTAIGK